MPQSFEEDFCGPQPRRSASRGRLFEIDDEPAHRIPYRLRVGVLKGEWNWGAFVGGKQAHAKSTRLPIWDQDAGQALFFRGVGESGIHGADDAKVLNACVGPFAQHSMFLRAEFGLCGLSSVCAGYIGFRVLHFGSAVSCVHD